MTVEAAEMFWAAVALWLAVGSVVATVFAVWGAAATDHAATGAGIGFRLLIIPGAAILWPYMLARLLSGRRINAPIRGRGEPR